MRKPGAYHCFPLPSHTYPYAFTRIAYVRFDGKMSAKARKDVIEKFTVPVDGDEDEDSDTESSPPMSPVAKRQRRGKRKNSVIVIDASESESSATEEDTDDEFVDGADLIAQAKASNGKGKGPGKIFKGAWGNKSNPKVMLISLKAGALGLNLTVANNVFL